MKCLIFVGAMASCAVGAAAFAEDLDTVLARFQSARQQAPNDVAAYMERHMICWHFGGEEVYSDARKAEITRAAAEYKCATLPADQVALRRAYADMPAAIAALDAAAGLR
jgi:hypothetical protein